MTEFTLELIAQSNDTYGSSKQLVLPVVNHVHKRLERFVYQQHVRQASVPIAYLENVALDSRANLRIANRTFSIPANTPKLASLQGPMDIVVGNSYGSKYKNVAATNKTFVDSAGVTRPLFWRHDLPANTVEVSLQIRTRGNRRLVDTGYVESIDDGAIYTNYRNYFDPDTGDYSLYFVITTDSAGGTTYALLNPQPVAREATYEDIDLTTGKLDPSLSTYSSERSASGYTYYFSKTDTWYIRPLERSLLQPLAPGGTTAKDSWFMSFSDGDFSTNVNDAVHRYHVPEFHKQPFSPTKPYIFSPYETLLRVNGNVLAATRKNIAILPDNILHISIFVYDVEGVLIKVLSTDTALEGVRFGNTEVFYETDKIVSWDNRDALIALGIELHPSWNFTSQYHYEAQDYQYTLVDLNPIVNPEALKNTYVFYAVPDADSEDRAIHHLVVDATGKIIDTSQDLGLTHPNFKLLNSDNTFNSDTIIGLTYISDIVEDTFVTRYTAGFDNDYAYAILAEVNVLDLSLEEDQFVHDVRRPGGVIFESRLDDVLLANSKILQSHLVYGEDGQEYPQNAVMVMKAPLTLLEDYGGSLTQEEAEKLLQTYLPSAGYAVIEFVGPKSELSGWSQTTATVTLEATWEGPNLDYRLYRRANPVGEWLLIDTASSPAEGTIVYTDTDVASGETYYYSVRIYDGSVEYSASNSLGVKVR